MLGSLREYVNSDVKDPHIRFHDVFLLVRPRYKNKVVERISAAQDKRFQLSDKVNDEHDSDQHALSVLASFVGASFNPVGPAAFISQTKPRNPYYLTQMKAGVTMCQPHCGAMTVFQIFSDSSRGECLRIV